MAEAFAVLVHCSDEATATSETAKLRALGFAAEVSTVDLDAETIEFRRDSILLSPATSISVNPRRDPAAPTEQKAVSE